MSIRNHLAGFGRAEDGTAAILWAMSLVVVFGFVALAFDIGRVGATQSELQSFADNVALAAAGELDGRTNARARAQAAAAVAANDAQTFATGGHALTAADYPQVKFYSAIPANDDDPMTLASGAIEATSDWDAIYAEVVMNPRTVATVFRRALNALTGAGGGATADVGAAAVAGYTQVACDITPLMFCLPGPSFTANDNIGKMVKLRAGGGGAQWLPGNFGFLDISQASLGSACDSNNGNIERCLLATERDGSQCYFQRGVITNPGQRRGITDVGLNVRFDLYAGNLKPSKDGNSKNGKAEYPPAPNVVSGLHFGSNACNANQVEGSTDTVGLPRDDCFKTENCAHDDRFGTGDWDYDGYMATNHGARTAVVEGAALPSMYSGFAGSGTRYELYLREIAAASGGPILLDRDVTGLAQCGAPSVHPERRVIIAAGIDCETYADRLDSGGSKTKVGGGGRTTLPVEEFFEIFLTEPVGEDPDDTNGIEIWGEIVGSAGGQGSGEQPTGGVIRDVVQLYR